MMHDSPWLAVLSICLCHTYPNEACVYICMATQMAPGCVQHLQEAVLNYTNRFFAQVLTSPEQYLEQRFNANGNQVEVGSRCLVHAWSTMHSRCHADLRSAHPTSLCTFSCCLLFMQYLFYSDATFQKKLKIVPGLYRDWTSWLGIRRYDGLQCELDPARINPRKFNVGVAEQLFPELGRPLQPLTAEELAELQVRQQYKFMLYSVTM